MMSLQMFIRTCYYSFLATCILYGNEKRHAGKGDNRAIGEFLAELFENAQPGNTLQCYECDESFTDVDIWVPLDCQVNATAVPVRVCNYQQPYCYVSSATVKGILTQISRNCIDECYYGCVASEFGITMVTCTSCCDEDFCNTGNAATHSYKQGTHFWSVSMFAFLAQIYHVT